MQIATTAKKMAMSFHVITFFSSIASGMDKPTTAIINAMAMPIGIPFATNTCMMGKIPAALLYMGTPTNTASGTDHQASLPMNEAMKSCGTQPWMPAPMAMPARM